MTSETFVKTLLEQLPKRKEWGIEAENIRLYEDGFTSADGNKEDLDFIRSTNIRYHKVESDTLIGSFLVITKKSSNKDISSICRFEIAYLFREFEQSGWDAVWNIIDQNIKQCDFVDQSGILSSLNNYDAAKEHLIIRPINFNDHRFELKNCIYRREGDIALVLYAVIHDDGKNLQSAKIPQNTFQEWNQDQDAVWEAALLNTYVLAPPRIYLTPMECIKPAYTQGAFMALGSPVKKILPQQVPTVTTTRQTNGAIALFYPGVKEKISEMAGGSFYAAFTSIHDVRIHPEGTVPPRRILQSLKSVNSSFSPDEILSRKVFFYDAEKKTFSTIEL